MASYMTMCGRTGAPSEAGLGWSVSWGSVALLWASSVSRVLILWPPQNPLVTVCLVRCLVVLILGSYPHSFCVCLLLFAFVFVFVFYFVVLVLVVLI